VFLADADTMLRVERNDTSKPQAMIHMVKQKDATEWEKPIIVEARSIILDPATNAASLAMAAPQAAVVGSSDPKATSLTPATAGEIQHRRNTGSAKHKNQNTIDKDADAIIDRTIEKVLRENPIREWSKLAMAELLNHRHGDLYSISAIRQRVLPRLIADKTSATHRCFNDAKSRFRWATG